MHVNYTDIISKIATSSWGKDFSSKEQAEKELLADKQALGAFAAVELLRRLECLASSLGGRETERDNPRVYMPDEAAVFPDVKVGDRLFEYSVDEGMAEFIVVAKDDENHCMMVAVDDFDLKYGPATRVADEDTKTTPQEAMLSGAERQLGYWAGEVDFARKLIEAAKKKQPLDSFRDGLKDDDA